MSNYNQIEAQSALIAAAEPSPLLGLIWNSFKTKSTILDLGCGTETDAVFLANHNFKVTALDRSAIVISRLEEIKNRRGLNNLELINGDLRKTVLVWEHYQVVIAKNILNFLDKPTALKLLRKIKKNLPSEAYVIITVFTKKDPSYGSDYEFASYFEDQELAKLFKDFTIKHYFEGIIDDSGHPGFLSPHQHGVARLIAQKP
jgi:cyclopropane fatty-acyl-phospholipid synthase-like methyltransferase